MNVVLDTNVIVSGFMAAVYRRNTVTGAVFHAWRTQAFSLVTSRHLIGEVSDTFDKPFFARRINADQIARIKALLEQQTQIVVPATGVSGVATHPEDDLVLAAAVAGECEYLVTSDTGLLRVASFRGLSIVTPAEFLQVLRNVDRG